MSKSLFFLIVFLLALAGSVEATRNVTYVGNNTAVISEDGMDLVELQVLNPLVDNTFTDFSPLGGRVKLRVKFLKDTQFDDNDFRTVFDVLGHERGQEPHLIKPEAREPVRRKLVTKEGFTEREVRRTGGGNVTEQKETERVHFNYTENVEEHRALSEMVGSLPRAGEETYFEIPVERAPSLNAPPVDVQFVFYGVPITQFAWFNTTYSYCRTITGFNETRGMTLLNEPFNHGKGIFVDASGWANLPHRNGHAYVNAPCNQDGSLLLAETIQMGLNASGNMVNFTFHGFGNSTPWQNQSYAIYYSTGDVGRPVFNSSSDLTITAEDASTFSIRAGGFSVIQRKTSGGIDTVQFQERRLDSTGPYGWATYFQNTSVYYDADTLGHTGTVACSPVWNFSLIKTFNCTNTATNATVQQRFYPSLGTNNFIDYTYTPGLGLWNIRQDMNDTDGGVTAKIIFRVQNPSVYANYTLGVDGQFEPNNAAVYLRRPTARNLIVVGLFNNSKGARSITLNTAGGNTQMNFWQGGALNPRQLNFSADARMGAWNASSYSDAAGDNLTSNLSDNFQQSYGAILTFGAETVQSGPAAQNCTSLSYTGAVDGANSLYTLTQDVSANGTCFIFPHNNVTLDCNGYKVYYAQGAPGDGAFFGASVDNVTIRDCTFIQNSTQASSVAIRANATGDNSTNVTFFNNTIYTNGSSSIGISQATTNYSSIVSNVIFTNGTSATGISLTSTFNQTLAFNSVFANSSGNALLVSTAPEINATYNNFTTMGATDVVSLTGGSTKFGFFTFNNVSGLIVSTSALTLLQLSDSNFSHNNIYVKMNFLSSTNAFFIRQVDRSVIGYNNLYAISTGSTSTTAVMFMRQTNNNTVIGNLIVGNGTRGIRNTLTATGDFLIGNRIYVNGTNGFAGIELSSANGNATLINNTVQVNESNSLGIFISASNNHKLIGNDVNARGNVTIGLLVANSNWTSGWDNTINASGNQSAAVFFSFSNSSNFTNSTVFARFNGINSTASVNNTFNEGKLVDCGAACMNGYTSLSFNLSANLTTVNFTFNQTNLTWGQGLNNNLTIQWYARANTTYFNLTALSGALVNVTNSTSNRPMHLRQASGSDGLTPWLLVTQFWGNNTSNRTFTPHNFTALNASGALANYNTTNATLNSSQTVLMVLVDSTAPQCGRLTYRGAQEGINSIYTLESPLWAYGGCFTIADNNVTLDCAGYKVTYAISNQGHGINYSSAAGFSNITVRGCQIEQGSTNSSSRPLNFITDNTAQANVSVLNNSFLSQSSRVHFNGTSNITFFNNNVTQTAADYAVFFDNGSRSLNASFNRLLKLSGNGNQVLRCTDCDYSNLTANNLTSIGVGEALLVTSSVGLNASFNNISTTGTADVAIWFAGTSNTGNLACYNNVATSGTGSHGISDESGQNTFCFNNVNTSGTTADAFHSEDEGSVTIGNFFNATGSIAAAYYADGSPDWTLPTSSYGDTLFSRTAAVNVSQGGNVFIENTTIRPCVSACRSAYGQVFLDGASTLKLLNMTSFDQNNVTLAGNPNNLTVQWYARINSTFEFAQPVQIGVVNITNTTGSVPQDATFTNSSGVSPWFVVTQSTRGSANTSFNPHLFSGAYVAGITNSTYLNVSNVTNSTTIWMNFTDGQAPRWRGSGTNGTTCAGCVVTVFANWTDNGYLSCWLVSINGGSGTFVNTSIFCQGPSLQSNWTNYTFTLNSTPGTTVQYYIWHNDTASRGNQTTTASILTADTQAPQYGTTTINTTAAGALMLTITGWTDNSGLANFTVQFNNGSGTAFNYSIGTSMKGVSNTSNFTTYLNATVGSIACLRTYARDLQGNLNATPDTCFEIGGAPKWFNVSVNSSFINDTGIPGHFQPSPGNFLNFTATWNASLGLSGFIFSTNMTGDWVNDSWRPLGGTLNVSNASKTQNTTLNRTWGYVFYVNDSSGAWNGTGVRLFQTVNITGALRRSANVNSINLTQCNTNFTSPTNQTNNTGLLNYTNYGSEAVNVSLKINTTNSTFQVCAAMNGSNASGCSFVFAANYTRIITNLNASKSNLIWLYSYCNVNASMTITGAMNVKFLTYEAS